MSMLEGLLQYNKVHRLMATDTKIVLALSGGVDSMALAHLLLRMKAHFVVAHCNFHLRGAESDGDERFVRDFAQDNGIQCFVKHFETEQYAKQQGVSIEMAARDLRYAWFDELRIQLGFDKIALAHHADDQVETFFINLLRGAGINGLKGMRPQNGVLIRPLLWASREQIKNYALENQIVWREDHTNAESVYLRNKIRNELMPVLDSIIGEARSAIGKSVGHLASENDLYRELLKNAFSEVLVENGGTQSVQKAFFRGLNGFQMLFEWLRPVGFNSEQCRFIIEAMETGQGKHFFSTTHRLSIEREVLQLAEIVEKQLDVFFIGEETCRLDQPVAMRFASYERDAHFELKKARTVVMLDREKLKFPLVLRRWQRGDRFHPLGMKGSKLLSDFFVDQKFTTEQKENQWLLVNGDGAILWVVGHRIDERYKVTSASKYIFQCDLNA